MKGFFSKLTDRITQSESLLCVGLDPHPQDLDQCTGEAARDFCTRLIDMTHQHAAAFKPNSAFFEELGAEGMEALRQVITAVPDDIPVILDVKRGDIASTAKAYARATFNFFQADAVTVNPYLGRDALTPFLAQPSRGAFVLCKTSNPGASDLQNLLVHSEYFPEPGPLYQHIALLVESLNTGGNLGLVVGATQPESLAVLRKLVPEMWFLAPGIGAQGGNLEKALQAGLRGDGSGMLLPVSRGISRAENPRAAAEQLQTAINQIRVRYTSTGIPAAAVRTKPLDKEIRRSSLKEHLAVALFEAGCVKFGTFTLKSGRISPIYIDLRRLIAFPELLKKVSRSYHPILEGLDYHHLAGLPYAALPIATAVSLETKDSLVYPRKERKDYGTKAVIEGVFEPGERVVIIDDLITTGGSKLEAVEKLRSRGLIVSDVVVLIDRSTDARSELEKADLRLHAVLDLPDLLEVYTARKLISREQGQNVLDFIEGKN